MLIVSGGLRFIVRLSHCWVNKIPAGRQKPIGFHHSNGRQWATLEINEPNSTEITEYHYVVMTDNNRQQPAISTNVQQQPLLYNHQYIFQRGVYNSLFGHGVTWFSALLHSCYSRGSIELAMEIEGFIKIYSHVEPIYYKSEP